MLATALTIAEILYVLGMVAWIALQKRSPVATLAWILLVAALPIAGFVVYYLIGHRRPKRVRLKRLRAKLGLRAAKDHLHRAGADGPEVSLRSMRTQQLMRLATEVADAPPSTASSVRVLQDGDATFDAIEEAIRAARHHVHLEYYIFEPDRTGTRVRDLLVERARAGVEVRLLVDGVGSHRLGRRFLAPLRAAGARVASFGSVALPRLRPQLVNFRTHRKIAVIDGAIGFTGGINVTDDEVPSAGGPRAYRDTHVRLEGAVVRWLQLVFLEDWHYATGHAPVEPTYFPAPADGERRAVQILASGPDSDHEAIHKLYFAAIASSRARVLVATPYFVPDEPMLTALTTAALRGVDVRVIVPRRSDSRVVTAAARSYFADLVSAGVRVFEYTPRMLHAKVMVVDDDFAAIGTANMDNRSFRLNYEVTAVAFDADVARSLAEAFAEDERRSRPIERGGLANAPLGSRLFQAGARLLSPML